MDQQNKVMMESSKELFKLSEYYYQTFLTTAGDKVLKDLSTITRQSNLSPNKALDFQAEVTPEILMAIREGQNQLVRYIEQMMNYYRENRNG